MTDLIELLNKPKQWVNKCQQHLTELGYTEPYNFSRFINEELGELVGNFIDGKHENNRALLIDDLCDSIWTVLAKIGEFDSILAGKFNQELDWQLVGNTDDLIYRIGAYWFAYQRKNDESYLVVILLTLFNIAELENVNYTAAFAALVAENYSKLPPIGSSKELIKEIFRDNKIQKRDLDGNYYQWFKPADFSVF